MTAGGNVVLTPVPKICQNCFKRTGIERINNRWRCAVCLELIRSKQGRKK